MENKEVKIKRGRGRPRILTDQERINHKTTYMLNKEWYCDICRTGRNYSLAGKSCHLKTKKTYKKRQCRKHNEKNCSNNTQIIFFNIVRRIHVLDHLNF